MRTMELKCHVERVQSSFYMPALEMFEMVWGRQGFTVHCVTLLQLSVLSKLCYWR